MDSTTISSSNERTNMADNNNSENPTPLISARGLKKRYQMGEQTLWALKGVDVDIYEGEFVAVMGPSGSGKSTFMNMAGFLDVPSEGSLKLGGTPTETFNAVELARIRNERLGFVFQQFNLLPRTSALENVQLPLFYSTVPDDQWTSRAEARLNMVGLGDRMKNHPSQLSGGQQQRVAIARALINDPVLIMADEPTGALDTKTGYEILALFQQLNAEGKTIVLVTHEPDIAAFASRTLLFRDGILESDQYQTPLVATDFLK